MAAYPAKLTRAEWGHAPIQVAKGGSVAGSPIARYASPDMQRYQFPVVIESDEHGYFAYCPSLQGCYTQGETYEEALRHIQDAIKLHIEDRRASEEDILPAKTVSLSTIDVTV